MSQSDLRLHFGLGRATVIDVIEVQWPTTRAEERFAQVHANQILIIREGSGIVDTFKPKATAVPKKS
jgi:enediyne biosynthesis protein E4